MYEAFRCYRFLQIRSSLARLMLFGAYQKTDDTILVIDKQRVCFLNHHLVHTVIFILIIH